MRGGVETLGTPYPLVTLMPAVYQEDGFTTRWTAGLDDVLAPIVSTLDCIGAYLDPLLSPPDFLAWLAEWFGTALDENWPLSRQREAVARSVELYRMRGTVAGLRAQLELVTGGEVEVADNGGASWSAAPTSDLPERDGARLTVRIRVRRAADVDMTALNAVITAVKPAHVVHEVEVTER